MLKGDTTDEYYTKCKSWSLTIGQLKNIIQEFEPVSSEAQHLSYSYMSCRMEGKIEIDNKEFTYWINAGSTLILESSTGAQLYFACSNKTCEKFFLTGKDSEEELWSSDFKHLCRFSKQ